jgi:spore germination protein
MRTGFRRPFQAAALLLLLSCSVLPARADQQEPTAGETPRPAFAQIWAYLMRGEEDRLTGTEPITDICYVGASLARNGRINDSIPRPVLTVKDGRKPVIHLVVAELSNTALMHFALTPTYGVTPLLVGDIIRVAQDFDGVQIDFESVARDDADAFIAFLGELRQQLPAGKTLSIAVPARTRRIEDAYAYGRIAPLVDRMVIMAYDEHWSTSSAGPVASLPWCEKVVDYAKSAVDVGKIIMGLPLYGRAWQDKRLAKALRFENVQDLVTETNSSTDYSPDLGAHFEYSESVVVSVFFDDLRSLMDKLWLYRIRDIGAVSFWRIGQGPPELWGRIERAGSPASTAAGAPEPVPTAGGS